MANPCLYRSCVEISGTHPPSPRRMNSASAAGSRCTAPMPRSRDRADQRIVGAEQPVERVGRRQHHQIVRPAQALVAGEQRRVAGVRARPRPPRSPSATSATDIAEAEIEALARDRMDAVRGIAHQRQPRVVIAVGVHGRERIAPASADHAHRTEMRRRGGGAISRLSAASSSRSSRWAIGVRSVQTMAETFGAPVGAAHRQLRERAGREGNARARCCGAASRG